MIRSIMLVSRTTVDFQRSNAMKLIIVNACQHEETQIENYGSGSFTLEAKLLIRA